MLVLYTLFSNTSDALPVTAYVKMIDVWFFACIMFLFSVTMVHVLTEYLQTREERRKVMMNVVIKVGQKPTKKIPDYHRGDLPLRVMLWSRTLVLPLAALIFNVVYWAMLTERPDALSPRD
ncbi:hypothetical protein Pmani_037929 [Petrolisthes manimaculis]|uniref:Uncharacterized protein n=1 Tax=Petrolisthes manimaculis TaxID=1843537 RepID=A0AAE1NHD5_9EUCA|nr:hypothetical protein Pmani_037929 [Petrolisthes manimaculis]